MRILKTVIILALITGGVLGIAFYWFLHLDFVGTKDPKIMEENNRRLKDKLLSAEYRQGADYCTVDIMDSVNIEITSGDQTGGIILMEKYKIENDTIFIVDWINRTGKYLYTDKFVIQGNKLLFKPGSDGGFDTVAAMRIRFNKIKL